MIAELSDQSWQKEKSERERKTNQRPEGNKCA
jgi:hypothetical protein